eukprot:gene11122-11276_t
MEQHKCKGILVFEQAGGTRNYSSTCYGLNTSQAEADAVDLLQHHEGEVPPPFCLGVEFMRYGKAVMKSRQGAGAGDPHGASLASAVSAASDASSVPSMPLPGYHHSTQTDIAGASDGGSSRQPAHALHAEAAGAQQQRLSLMERLQETREQLQERLEGKDPLWFAKAFANRAELNLQSMRRMAGQLAAAARADLGLGPEPSDDDDN